MRYDSWIVSSTNLLHAPTPTDIAWAAGLFEGEGCIAEHTGGWGLQLLMTDADVVLRFEAIAGAGSTNARKPAPENHKIVYVWRTRRAQEVERLLGLFLPYLGQRRRGVAETALASLKETCHRTCEWCDEPFVANRHQKKFCSRPCFARHRAARLARYRGAKSALSR